MKQPFIYQDFALLMVDLSSIFFFSDMLADSCLKILNWVLADMKIHLVKI